MTAVALVLLPAASAAAKSTTHVGSNPSSAFCVAIENEQAGVSKNQSEVKKDMASGQLSLVKKASLEIYGIDMQAAQNVQSALGSAPAKVKAAVAATLKFDATLKSIIKKSKTLAGLTAAETAAAGNPKVTNAGQVLTVYFNSQCDTRTTTPKGSVGGA
ncbi:MAG TPA: hypothetical protein VHV57_15280 [Acidimicrobiales bacterium]|nr:hypothetical protein [Acidimicrobiales bacterium]